MNSLPISLLKSRSRAISPALVAVLCASGCASPWFHREARDEARRERLADERSHAGAAEEQRQRSGQPEQRVLNEVLDELQALSGKEPEAQQRLLADLKRTDPALWPQLLQSFRSTLAYRDQVHPYRQQELRTEEQLSAAAYAAGEDGPATASPIQVAPNSIPARYPETARRENASHPTANEALPPTLLLPVQDRSPDGFTSGAARASYDAAEPPIEPPDEPTADAEEAFNGLQPAADVDDSPTIEDPVDER